MTNDNIKNKSNEIINFLTTDYIYLDYDEKLKLLYKDKDYIYKNDVVMEGNNRNIYSSVSGNLLGLTNINNKKYLVIENDFRDRVRNKVGTKRDISNYSKDEFIDLLRKYNALNFDANSKVLIINGIEEYLGEDNYNLLIQNYTIQLLDTIDAIIDIMNIKKCFLTINNNNIDCVNLLVNNLGTYPKIDLKLFSYDYSLGNKEIIIDRLTSYKNKNYNIMFLNIVDVINIHTILKRKRYNTETYITITGDIMEDSRVVRVKHGTNLADILNYFKICNRDNVIINGLLNGIKLNDVNFIIDNKIRSIFINSIPKYKESKCINCGICLDNCPININPKYMYFNKDKKALKYREECINCGICSYLCPSKINLNKGCKSDDN